MVLYEFQDYDYCHTESLVLQDGVYFIYSQDRDLYKTSFPKPWQKSHILADEKEYYTFKGVLKEQGYRLVLLTYTPTDDVKYGETLTDIEEKYLYGDNLCICEEYPVLEDIHHEVSGDLDKFIELCREHCAIDADVCHLIIYGIEREYQKLGDYDKAVAAFFQNDAICSYIIEMGGTYDLGNDNMLLWFYTKGQDEYATFFAWESRKEAINDK
jgi:hypothetical protein